MNMEQIVREILTELNCPPESATRAIEWATITLPNSRKMSQMELSPTEARVMRHYFRALLLRIAIDPDFRNHMAREMKKAAERN